jgi:hypothetical protein
MHAATAALSSKGLALEAPFPEATGAAVLTVGPAHYRLAQTAHEPRYAPQPPTQFLDALGITAQRLLTKKTGLGIDHPIHPYRKQLHPAFGDLLRRPGLRRNGIHMKHHVQMVAHDRVRVQADGETVSQLQQPIFDPLPTMLE